MKQDGLQVIGSLAELVERHQRMEAFLEKLWSCGSAYGADEEKLMAFLNSGDHYTFTPQYKGQSPRPGWWELRDLLRPDFDDSE